MKTLKTIASEIRALLADDFPTIRYAPAASGEAVSRGIRAIAADSAPAAILTLDEIRYDQQNLVRTLRFSVFAVGRFSAGGDSKSENIWDLADTLQSVFPMTGRKAGDIFYLPESLSPVTDRNLPDHAVFVMRLRACE